MRLVNKTTGKTLISRLEVAGTFWSRNKGLLGRKHLSSDQALLIPRCNAIHTFFMKFPIDLVFVNRKMVVTKTMTRVKPGRVVLPVWRAWSVIECCEGFLTENPVRVGEELHVDHSLS